MNERVRMQYLETMGIDSFVPRRALLLAKPSGVCELPFAIDTTENELQLPQNGDSQQQPISKRGVRRAGDIIASIANIENLTGSPSAPVDNTLRSTPSAPPDYGNASEVSEESVPPEQEANFTLSIWRPHESLLVVDSHREGAALPTDRLLANILRHSPWKVVTLNTPEIIRWPPQSAPLSVRHWDAAKEMMGGFLDARLLAQPVDTFLVFGEEAYRAVNGECLTAESPYAEVEYNHMQFSAYAVGAIVLPSLADLLVRPQDKAKVWSLISGAANLT